MYLLVHVYHITRTNSYAFVSSLRYFKLKFESIQIQIKTIKHLEEKSANFFICSVHVGKVIYIYN